MPRLAIDDAAVAARLAEAIRLKTVSEQGIADPSDDVFGEMHALLARDFPALHRELRREVVAEHSLLYSWGEAADDAAGDAVLLAAHLDVVPVEAEQWSRPPFGGVIEGGYIWGRGTLDDKSSVLAIMEAVEYLVEAGYRPSRRIYLAFGFDEENHGTGAAAIADLLASRGERLSMVLDEGGFVVSGVLDGVERPIAAIGLAEKGYLMVELSADAVGGHASVPPDTTAIGRIARAAAQLEEHQMPSRLGPLARLQLESVASEMPLGQRLALSNTWLFGGLVLRSMESSPTTAATVRTTTAVTLIDGGVKGNVLPSHATAMVNFRILPGDSAAAVLAHIDAVIDDPEVTVRVLGDPTEPSPVSSVDGEGYVAIAAVVAEMFPDALVTPLLVVGMTDSRRYQGVADGVYRFLPIRMQRRDIDRMHGIDERISIDGYTDMIRFYVRLIRRVAGD